MQLTDIEARLELINKDIAISKFLMDAYDSKIIPYEHLDKLVLFKARHIENDTHQRHIP